MAALHHGHTFIEHPDANSLIHHAQPQIGGTPNSNNQNGTKRGLVLQSSHQPFANQIHQSQAYETSPPTQKQKGVSLMSGGGSSGSNMKIMSTTASKSRQPNHIISCGGINSNKLGLATVQDAA